MQSTEKNGTPGFDDILRFSAARPHRCLFFQEKSARGLFVQTGKQPLVPFFALCAAFVGSGKSFHKRRRVIVFPAAGIKRLLQFLQFTGKRPVVRKRGDVVKIADFGVGKNLSRPGQHIVADGAQVIAANGFGNANRLFGLFLRFRFPGMPSENKPDNRHADGNAAGKRRQQIP